MFDLFSSSSGSEGGEGLSKMRADFGQMLDSGRHVFDTAANAFLGGTDLSVIRHDLFATDKRINKAEQQIRRQIVVHASVHGSGDFPGCLVLMSVVKDAERVGDYSKNIFDLAELSPHPPAGAYRDSLIELKDQISVLMADCRVVFDTEDASAAREQIAVAERIEDQCDDKIAELIQSDDDDKMSVTYALAYRYFKRVTSHIFNVMTTVVQPIHKIDFAVKPEKPKS